MTRPHPAVWRRSVGVRLLAAGLALAACSRSHDDRAGAGPVVVDAGPESAPPAPALPATLPAELAAVAPARSAAEKQVTTASGRERAALWLTTGALDRARAELPTLIAGDLADRLVALRLLSAIHDADRRAALIAELLASDPDAAGVRDAAYRWWLELEDLERLSRALAARTAAGATDATDRLAAARLAAALHDDAAARDGYVEVATAADPELSARAHIGLSALARDASDPATALSEAQRALRKTPLDPDALVAVAESLIRLGRTDDAIATLDLTLELAPYHLRAHYLLGSGYARRNYTELYAAFPERFSHGAGRVELRYGEGLAADGRLAEARAWFAALARRHPDWADVAVRRGGLAYAAGDFAAARREFVAALALCPEYGRGHIGLARTIEALRAHYRPHRAEAETALDAAPMPSLPDIERLVINWRSLAPRHQKRLALSIAPWRRYLPVLVASGATIYIKPLYQILSDAPGQDKLRDARVSYDSRLWDDVRGGGGYRTVAGIEDVEARIDGGYDTVLHELSHQVHQVLAPEWTRRIDQLYAVTRQRQRQTGDAFLSAYAGSSVWEYFAEGANSLATPRRDRWDPREIVRERLEQRDPDLAALVDEIMHRADVEPSFAVGLSARGSHLLELGDADGALAAYREALQRAPGDESVISASLYALTVTGHADRALAEAEVAERAQPTSAAIAIRLAYARWLAGPGLPAAIAVLVKARKRVHPAERYVVDLVLGNLLLTIGDPRQSERAYRAVLEERADSSDGLWGLARAKALAEQWDEAWKAYQSAVRRRTGVVELRDDFALDLLRAGEIDRASEQIEAALLLDPDDPRALALAGWRDLERGDSAAAADHVARARKSAPWCDLAVIVAARIQRAAGDRAGAAETVAPLAARIRARTPPEFVYRDKKGIYQMVHALPGVEQILVRDLIQ